MERGKAFTNLETAAFCGQMALILKAGISSMEGITTMLEEAETQEEKEILEAALDEMQMTGSLYQALQKADVFPAYMLHMVEIGEETGNLDEVMSSLQKHYEREESIGRMLRNAVTYPMVMICMMIAVIVILLVKVMPIFQQVFVQLGTEMTGVSAVLVGAGNVINRYAIVFIVVAAVLVFLFFFGTRSAKGKTWMRNLGYRIGVTRKMYEKTAACRFAGGMALTLSSGLNPERSMELVTALNEDPEFARKLEVCKEKTENGVDLAVALYESGIFTGVYARMASIGSKAGALDEVMNQIAELYEEELDTRMNNVLAVLEPTLVIVLSLIVGVILLSVMFPLMGIMSGL